MIETVGFVVLGQSSVDDVVPALTKRLPSGIRVLRRGALDGLTSDEIAALAPAEGEYLLVCKVEPGREAQVVFDRMLPRVQSAVDTLVSEGADLIVVLCGANWSELKCDKMLVNPGAILPRLVIALSSGKKLGLVMPTVLQEDSTQRKYHQLGAADVVATHVTIYEGTDLSGEIQSAADCLVAEGVDVVWMPCLGMNDDLRASLHERVGKPTLLAQSMLAKVVNELIGA